MTFPTFRRALPLLGLLTALPSAFSGVDFVHEVMPVLKKYCAECHTSDKKKGGLAMNTRAELLAGSENGEVLLPGDPDASLLLILCSSKDEDEWMPPKGDRVPAEQIEILRQWIKEGATWEAGITLGDSAWEAPLRPRTVTLPKALDGRDHPIDRILDDDLQARGETAPPQASDAAFLRRLTLDLIGLLPTPEDLEAFLADPSPTRRQDRIDALLADDIGYADHWLTTWNDLLRNDYAGTGYIDKGRTQITEWLYASLHDNKPYDQFVRELVSPTKASEGFIKGIQWRGNVNASQTRDIQFAQNVSQVFLGINMKCASCHDSFIDRWTLQEAYNLAAVTAEKPLELYRCDQPTGVMAQPAWPFPELGDVDPEAPRAERLAQLAELMTHRENGRFTRTAVNRIWARLMGRGIIHPVDAMSTRPWNADLLDFLAEQFVAEGYDQRKFLRFVMTSQAYQSQTVVLEKEPGADYRYSGPIAKRMTAEQFLDSIWQVTSSPPGNPAVQLDRFERTQIKATAPIRASWIWHQGQVGTKSELRRGFALETTPEKATLLATCDNAFVMKINGAQVAASRDWQTPVRVDVSQHLKVGENLIEVTTRMSGGGAGFIAQLDMKGATKAASRSIITDATWQARPPDGEWAKARVVAAHGKAPWGPILQTPAGRRPVRAALILNDFLMRSLGRPNREQVVTSRPNELSTLQAIDLANGDLLAGHLRAGAKNLTDMDLETNLGSWIFQYALSRPPNDVEQEVLDEVLGTSPEPGSIEDLLWLVFMQPEFQLIR